MLRYSVRSLLVATAMLAVLAFCATHLSTTTYFVGCVVLPLTLALISRHRFGMSHLGSLLLGLMTAIVSGSFLLAYGSYDQTFNKEAKGILVGGGLDSVVASAIVGGFLGLLGGTFSTLFYLGSSSLIGNLFQSNSGSGPRKNK